MQLRKRVAGNRTAQSLPRIEETEDDILPQYASETTDAFGGDSSISPHFLPGTSLQPPLASGNPDPREGSPSRSLANIRVGKTPLRVLSPYELV